MPAIKPFEPDDYRDPRTAKQKADERTEVQKQVQSLLEVATNNEYRRSVVDRLQDRRRDNPQRVQIESVARTGGLDLVVAAGCVVARSVDLNESARTRLSREFEIECPADDRPVVRLAVPRGATGRQEPTSELVKRICGCVPVSVDHVTPLAGHIKGAGGPEPSAGARRFPSIEITQASPPPVVAVLDTGISDERRGDKYLAMHVDPADLDPLDDFPPDGLLDAGAGHGAFVAGIVQQVAPTAPIYIHRVIDSDGITTDTEVADMMRVAVADGAKILNMSLGTETVDGKPPMAMLDVVTELAETHPDVLIVCAAGNGASTERIWPAAFASDFRNVVAVAALDPKGEPAPWSSHGDWVTCSAIGEGVVSTYVIGEEDGPLIDDPDPDTFYADSWATWSGTSFATPQICGAIVRIINESPAPLTPRQALDDLLARGADIPGYGRALEILPGT